MKRYQDGHRLEIERIFSGRWKVSRKLNGELFFSGQVEFADADLEGLLRYREEGEARYPGGFRAIAFREYYFLPRNAAFQVFFDQDKTRLFNSVTLKSDGQGLFGKDTHQCGNDIYKSEYHFVAPDEWAWAHRVSGPKKDYSLHSVYRRT